MKHAGASKTGTRGRKSPATGVGGAKLSAEGAKSGAAGARDAQPAKTARAKSASGKTAATKAEMERALRAMTKENTELTARLKRERQRNLALSDANRQAVGRLEAAIDRIKTLLVS